MPFLTSLTVREVDDSYWQLAENLVYQGNADMFTVPAGFKTDFASVPRALWNIIPPTGLHTKAAVIHDWLYHSKIVTRKDADGIFDRIMRESGVSSIKRGIMWSAVRLFGGFAWNK